MGTRSHTYFVEDGEPIVCLYRQMDGYIDAHGHDLARFLADKRVVNGYSQDDEDGSAFNGLGDLAVRTIVAVKAGNAHAPMGMVKGKYTETGPAPAPQDDIGNLYLYPADSPDQEDFGYWISVVNDQIRIRVTSFGKEIFEGTPAELLAKSDADFNDEEG